MPTPLATAGWRVTNLRAGVAAWIAGATTAPEFVLVDIGANDWNAPATSQATYEADLAFVLDAIHAAWAAVPIRVSIPWKLNFDAQADATAGWITTVLSTRGPWAAQADDERVWFKPNVATYSDDGVHFNGAGSAAKAAQALVVMGH